MPQSIASHANTTLPSDSSTSQIHGDTLMNCNLFKEVIQMLSWIEIWKIWRERQQIELFGTFWPILGSFSGAAEHCPAAGATDIKLNTYDEVILVCFSVWCISCDSHLNVRTQVFPAHY